MKFPALPLPVYQIGDAPAGAPATPPVTPPPAAPPPATPPAEPPKEPPVVTPPAEPPKTPPAAAAPPAEEAWRAEMVKGVPEDQREDMANWLRRYTSREAAMRAGYEGVRTLRSRPAAVPDTPPAADKPEELKAWREAKGIPDEATGYGIPDTLKEKVVDEDKPFIDEYFAIAHKANMPKAVVQSNLEFYFGLRDQQIEAEIARDKQNDVAAQVELKTSWGGEFTPNMNLANQYAETVMPGILDSRAADGRQLRHIPEVVKEFAQLGLRKFGDAAFAGGEATNFTQSRKAELLSIMKTNIDTWNASPELKREYENILAAEMKHQGATG